MAEPTTSSPAPPSTDGSAWKWWICILLLLATTLNYMDRQALYQTSVRISRDFRLSNEEYGELERSFNYAFGIGAVAVGFVVDKGNLRLIYPAIVFGWSLVGFATGYATSFAFLLVCRFMLGLFEAGNWPCGVLTVKRVLPPAQRSLGLGMFQSGTALGAIITPLVVLACLVVSDPHESVRTSLQMVVGGVGAAAVPVPEYSWQLPFRVIGLIGLLWAILWLATVRKDRIGPPPATPGEVAESYWSLWRNRRFWVLIVVILCVNITWRTFNTWLPKFLQEGRGYSERTTQYFSSLYYLGADVGSIVVGFVTIMLVNRGYRLHSARLIVFGFCALLTLLSLLAVTLPQGPALLVVVLLIGFGALGTFPTYFALSQEVTTKHQGKVTGTLGLINSIVIGTLAPLQGRLIDQTKSFSLALGTAGIPPLVALVVVYFFWNPPPKNAPSTTS